ncbi:fimbrial biogenesis chaperone [Nostoc sp.]|uniref:fimbrial biogenesis chaperone n=1 Tax=Nostoc sp. TaxID=1180 RepID=UPI002FF3DBB7
MQKLTRIGLALLTGLGLNLLSIHPSLASANFKVLPLNMSFEPSGRGATRSFRVESIGDEPVAVQIQMVSRQMKLDGTEINLEADNDFLVYPPQILLKPGQQQTVRVTWLGNPNPTNELAYRVITEQLPINLPQDRKDDPNQRSVSLNIKTLLRYLGSVYIVPKGVASQIVLDSAVHRKGKSGADELAVTFENQGSAHGLLRNLNMTITSAGQNSKSPQGTIVQIKSDQLKEVSGQNILAGNKRQFVISWPAGLPVGPITATFDVDQNR